jgi:branched-chain amino acid transport system ATP-binding protein
MSDAMADAKPDAKPGTHRDAKPSLLVVSDLVAGYGGASILNGVSFTLPAGASLALLGRNGAGKSTLIASIMGLTERHAGRVAFSGVDVTGLRPDQRARPRGEAGGAGGVGWVPQERNIFKSLTVEENLTAIARPGPWTVARVYALFPQLAGRRSNLGSQLSGGEQQLLAIGRALMLNPALLLLDEPLEGLAPLIAAQVLEVVRRLIKEEGLSAIVVEQHARKVLEITDRAVILERGSIVHASSSIELLQRPDKLAAHLGLGDGGVPSGVSGVS